MSLIRASVNSLVKLADYAALRAYKGRETTVEITGYLAAKDPSGCAGVFVQSSTDTTTADNGGTVLIDAKNRRWKRQFNGRTNIQWFGADPTYTVDSTAAIQAAVNSGGWNGVDLIAPKGTYRVDGQIVVGDNNGVAVNAVRLKGESAYGSVFLRPAASPTGPMFLVNGFHHQFETFGIVGNKLADNSGYSVSVGIKIRAIPQAGTTMSTKWCRFSNLDINQTDIGVQIGDYDVDGKHPDIETNSFHHIKIHNCKKGVFINGQNILHNPWYGAHITDCRDYLVHQRVGGDCWFERSYFGPMYDALAATYNVASTRKIFVEAGLVNLTGCRSEDAASNAQNPNSNNTARYALDVVSTDSVVSLIGNTFTTRDNSSTEPCVRISGQGAPGAATVNATLIRNTLAGALEINTCDIFSMGNFYKGTGAGVVNGVLRSANQKSGLFREQFMDANLAPLFTGGKFQKNSAAPVILERDVTAPFSEWLGVQLYDANGFYWGRVGHRVANSVAGQETSLVLLGARSGGTYREMGLMFGTAIPAAGVFKAGDRVMNSAPAVGQPKGWINTADGARTTTTRANSTAYALGTWATWTTGTTAWECTTAGNSAAAAPDITGKVVGNTIADGTAVWTMRATTAANFVSEGVL
jgi:hypothetical protein